MSENTELNGEKLNEDQQQQLLFVMLIQQHEQIALMGLGKTENHKGNMERDLKSAKYAIDTIVMLEKYTKGNLPKEISSYVTETLNKLRLAFADEKKKEKKTGDAGKNE